MSDYEMEDNEDDYVYESDGDDDGHSGSPRPSLAVSSSGASASDGNHAPYVVLNHDALCKEQNRIIGDIVELFSVTPFQARRMLMDFKWSKERLSEVLFKQSTDAVLKNCGVPRSSPTSLRSPEVPALCLICADDMTETSVLVNKSCGHAFCRECWANHIRVQVEENRSISMRCMMDKCSAVVCPNVLENVSLEKSVRDAYERSMLSHMIEVNPRVAWCPSQPCCGRAIRVSDSSTSRIDCECVCEEVFCFACKESSHSPAPCEWAKEWKKLCEQDSANAVYIARNCKPCPKCGKNIFKQDGCNHVTCPCGQSMCWLCGAATGRLHSWDSIHGHTCGKFRITAETEAANARKKMDKYLHYFEKYDVNMQSLRLASALKSKVDKTIGELEGSTSSLADWLSIGLHQLLRMRRFLAWSYAFAFYAFYEDNYEKLKRAAAQSSKSGGGVLQAGDVLHLQEVFEDLQTVLQQSVERLSQLVETPSGEMNETTKNNVLNLSSATHKNALALSDFVSNTLFSHGALGLDDPPAYFPIRRMVTGLGATASSTYSPVAAPLDSPVVLPGAKPKVSTGGKGAKPRSKAVEVVDLTHEKDEGDSSSDVVEVSEQRSRKLARVP